MNDGRYARFVRMRITAIRIAGCLAASALISARASPRRRRHWMPKQSVKPAGDGDPYAGRRRQDRLAAH